MMTKTKTNTMTKTKTTPFRIGYVSRKSGVRGKARERELITWYRST